MKQDICVMIFCWIFMLNLNAQSYRIETILPNNSSIIDDGLILDSEGNLYGSYWGVLGGAAGATVTKIAPDGTITELANGFVNPNGLIIGANDTIIVANFGADITKIAPDGSKQVLSNQSGFSNIIFQPGTDTLIATDLLGNALYKVAPDGTTQNYIASSQFNNPIGLTYDEEGRLYVGNLTDGKILRINAPNDIELIATITSGIGFITFSQGKILATAHTQNRVYAISLDGTIETIAGNGTTIQRDTTALASGLSGPNGIVATPSGDTIYISEFNTKSLRMLIRELPNSITEISEQNQIAMEAFPNPIQDQSIIRYSLTKSDRIHFSLTNNQGQVIRSWATPHLHSGGHQFDFSREDLPSGIYHLRLKGAYQQGKIALVFMD